MTISKVSALAFTCLASSLCVPAVAYDAGDWVLRVGAAGVFPNDDSDSLNAIAGAKVSVQDAWSLGITGTYMLSPRIGIGLLASWPFEHDIDGDGAIANLDKIGETKHLPPTLTLQYHFPTQTNIYPYLGVGINYTYFFDEQTSGALEGTKIDLQSSFGFAAEAGIDFEMENDWIISGQVWYADISTQATISGGPLNLNENVDVDIDPWIMMLSIGKKF